MWDHPVETAFKEGQQLLPDFAWAASFHDFIEEKYLNVLNECGLKTQPGIRLVGSQFAVLQPQLDALVAAGMPWPVTTLIAAGMIGARSEKFKLIRGISGASCAVCGNKMIRSVPPTASSPQVDHVCCIKTFQRKGDKGLKRHFVAALRCVCCRPCNLLLSSDQDNFHTN